MKKLLSLILVLVLLCPCLTVFASGDTYRLADLKLSVDIPYNLITFTRNIKPNDPNLDAVGLSKAEMDSLMEDGNIYLNAIDPDFAYEIIITKIESPLNDFYYFSNTVLDALASSFPDDYNGSGITIIKHEIYEHPQAKFIKVYTKQSYDGDTIYGLQYYTVYDSKAINFTIHSYTGSLTSKNEVTIKQIADSVVFDITPQKVEGRETPQFTYSDSKSGVSFTVPANWKKESFSKDRAVLSAKFVSTKESGCSIMFGSADMWAAASRIDRLRYSRADMNNAFFSIQDIAEIAGGSANQVKIEVLGGVEYYKVMLEMESDLYGINLPIVTTILIRIDNGMIYLFYFYGSDKSEQYHDFEKLICSVAYPSY